MEVKQFDCFLLSIHLDFDIFDDKFDIDLPWIDKGDLPIDGLKTIIHHNKLCNCDKDYCKYIDKIRRINE